MSVVAVLETNMGRKKVANIIPSNNVLWGLVPHQVRTLSEKRLWRFQRSNGKATIKPAMRRKMVLLMY
jgi:hypothetical protein